MFYLFLHKGFSSNPGWWVMVTPISQMRKERYRDGQGQAHLHRQEVTGLSSHWVSESPSWTSSLTAAVYSKHDLGRSWNKTEPELHICSSYMLGPTQLWDFMTLRPRLASELGVRRCGLPRGKRGRCSEASWPPWVRGHGQSTLTVLIGEQRT